MAPCEDNATLVWLWLLTKTRWEQQASEWKEKIQKGYTNAILTWPLTIPLPLNIKVQRNIENQQRVRYLVFLDYVICYFSKYLLRNYYVQSMTIFYSQINQKDSQFN